MQVLFQISSVASQVPSHSLRLKTQLSKHARNMPVKNQSAWTHLPQSNLCIGSRPIFHDTSAIGGSRILQVCESHASTYKDIQYIKCVHVCTDMYAGVFLHDAQGTRHAASTFVEKTVTVLQAATSCGKLCSEMPVAHWKVVSAKPVAIRR